MKTIAFLAAVVAAAVAVAPASPLAAQTREEATVQSSIQVLQEIAGIPAAGIPLSLIADAEGIAIVPSVIKLGFVVGGRRGRGVVMVRNEQRNWSNPVFVILTGGSLGYQIGVQATDVILVFKSRKSVDGIMRGKFTLGADAAVAAGPVGRNAGAATDAQLKAEIYTYSRSRGLFAGVALEGSLLEIDLAANTAFYGRQGMTPVDILAGGGIQVPQLVNRLQHQLSLYAPGSMAPTPSFDQRVVPSAAMVDVDANRRELAAVATRLYARLDDPWRQYLAVPPEVLSGQGPLNAEAAAQSLRRFDAAKADPRYGAVSAMTEFHATYALLARCVETASSPNAWRPLDATNGQPAGLPAIPPTSP